MSVEEKVQAEAQKVEAVVEGAAEQVKETVAEVVTKVKEALVQIGVEEKLWLREAELEYMKAQAEIQRLVKITETKSNEYQKYIEGLFKKYALDKAEYLFDGSVNIFKKL